ncbi:MAG: hypothetical protein SCARUB_01233 [Candidatus Scalindua rubra]|uniref:Uncharacterized protein n=1 Tax=Candidatus Scalindua rubra TaxID=1872076 RepID=A0A1E3XDE7_9BACT|nr:MAG: hypothetical protein SCARUB_01233 [Candidatus Scalindua rubra]
MPARNGITENKKREAKKLASLFLNLHLKMKSLLSVDVNFCHLLNKLFSLSVVAAKQS